MEPIEGLRFLASLPLAGTGRTEGGKKTQPFNRFHSRLFIHGGPYSCICITCARSYPILSHYSHSPHVDVLSSASNIHNLSVAVGRDSALTSRTRQRYPGLASSGSRIFGFTRLHEASRLESTELSKNIPVRFHAVHF